MSDGSLDLYMVLDTLYRLYCTSQDNNMIASTMRNIYSIVLLVQGLVVGQLEEEPSKESRTFAGIRKRYHTA